MEVQAVNALNDLNKFIFSILEDISFNFLSIFENYFLRSLGISAYCENAKKNFKNY